MSIRNSREFNTEILDNVIFGRVDPKIYAFTTETVPNYLKVGDTYRPIETRLNEWRNYFPDLKKHFEGIAKVDDEVFFRDHAVHYFLEHEAGKQKLKKDEIKDIPHYSQEFFRGATKKDIENAIRDIKKNHEDNQNKYQYYKFDESLIPETHTYAKLSEDYNLRPNQDKTVKKFKKAIDSGRSNLLMYAVMRFGKSFTSMCCAVEISASMVLVVSAKADVKEEWKKTVEESPKKFTDYIFLENKDLLESETVITDIKKNGKKVVIFLTLQDLQGKEIKRKHKEIFTNKIDLLIIDETHFGARAEEYGRVLRNSDLISKKDEKQELKLNDVGLDSLEEEMKTLNSKVRLHLSGTPYRILMGSEFEDDDIIAFYQFSDIAEDQKKWDKDYLNKDETKEWDNPYYGFPQMVRFAFNPNESSRKKMEELKSSGISYTLSALLKPQSITKDTKNDLHKKFIHEAEVLDLFKIIDGSKADANILNFLDYEKIKEGKMCRHIVCVLPYRASCDALESLLKTNKFKNLRNYEIVNISGVDGDKKYKTTQSIQSKIKDFESKNKKTITLTVNRMLTGSTVPEWDTMLYFKDTSSPQEYDQAVFRLQNQYIQKYKEPNGDTVKFNMKPQTLLVDFHPNRMFEVQEQKALIYNANTNKSGGVELKKQIQRELDISPIIVLNKNKIQEITPADILDAVRNYSKDRSIDDEARSISIDINLLNVAEIRAEIERQNEIGSKQGLEIESAQGEGNDLDTGEKDENGEEKIDREVPSVDKEVEEDFRKRFATYYMRILFFAFLTNSQVESVQDVIQAAKNNKDNQRIINNLGINISVLGLFQKYVKPFTVVELDRKIHNINSLANDKDVPLEERAKIAMKKFTRLSESEVVTPEFIADKIIDALPAKEVSPSSKILDIASKQGEFVYSVYKKFGKKVANGVYSIPTSKAAYEFTRKVYESLGLNIDNIEKSYTTYDFIKDLGIIEEQNVKINGMSMKFDVIVGNPPYHISDGGAQASAKPIYNEFVIIAKKLNPDYISIIMPTRWYAGGKGLASFRDEMLNDKHIAELHDFLKPDLVFKDVNLRGGVCYFLWNKNYDNTNKLTKVFTYKNDLNSEISIRNLKSKDSDILIRHGVAVGIFGRVKNHTNFKSFESCVSSRKPFNLEANIIENEEIFKSTQKTLKEPVICYGKNKKIGYIERKIIIKNTDWINRCKVFTPRANNIGTELSDDNLNAFIGESNTICTESYIVVGADLNLNKISASNICKYLTTRFVRFMHSIGKASQDATSKTYKFVPLQDFSSKSDIDWSKTISEIDQQLYKKYKLTKEEIKFIDNNIKPMK